MSGEAPAEKAEDEAMSEEVPAVKTAESPAAKQTNEAEDKEIERLALE